MSTELTFVIMKVGMGKSSLKIQSFTSFYVLSCPVSHLYSDCAWLSRSLSHVCLVIVNNLRACFRLLFINSLLPTEELSVVAMGIWVLQQEFLMPFLWVVVNSSTNQLRLYFVFFKLVYHSEIYQLLQLRNNFFCNQLLRLVVVEYDWWVLNSNV